MDIIKVPLWIWLDTLVHKDMYVDFTDEFEFDGSKTSIVISCDSNYVLYINGNFVESGQYPDFPYYKVYDKFDITRYCKPGKNRIDITVWYYGNSNMGYFVGDAKLYYQVFSDRETLAFSGEHTLSRINPSFVQNRCKDITGQLGYGFDFDTTAPTDTPYKNSVIVDDQFYLEAERPVKKLVISDPAESSCIKSENDTYFLYDLGRETVGYLDLKVNSPKKQHITVTFGEHIVDGGVRRIIGSRDFSVELTVGEGITEYVNYFRRLGLRYLEIFADSPLEVMRLTVRPCNYPLDKKPFDFKNELRNKIYEVSRRTLELCMHDHYEDCPWREQAHYAMDSRNQMLCGYYAFSEYAFPRAALYLMSKDDRADGQLSICTPSANDMTIPSFCLHWFTEVWEYTEYSGDTTLISQIYPKLQAVLGVFIGRLSHGLVKNFDGKAYWNFYEWRDGLDGRPRGTTDDDTDCTLNALLSIALLNMQKITDALGKKLDYAGIAADINAAINEKFYDPVRGLYVNSDKDGRVSELTNALCVLCGAATDTDSIAQMLTDDNTDVTRATLSMLSFKYDALLKIDSARYRDYILNDIDTRYKKMLDAGATSFWETEDGDADFHNAGSLCHGWSAMPVYYYSTLL